MAGQSKDIGIGDAQLEGGNLIGGPLGGPGREGKRLVEPQAANGDYTGPGVPTNPLRQNMTQQTGRSKTSPKNPNMGEGR